MAESSDDDMPIGMLSKKIEQKKQNRIVEESDDEDNIPISSLKPKSISSTKKVVDDSDDDLPLAQLAKSDKMKMKVKAEIKSPKGFVAKKKQKTKILEKLKEKKKAVAKKAPARRTQNVVIPSKTLDASTISGLYKKSTKGEIVKRLLCRWWYAIEWPSPEDIITPPKGYEPLDGYPGVYVCVKGDKIGALLDNRNEQTCPNFSNLIQKDTEELKTLLIKALENQLAVLKEHEGSNSTVEGIIKKEMTWANKVNVKKSDDYSKRLQVKANKLRNQKY
mmetsp:Transcript_4454/g.6150  ORF Transcript_4454/g.6150 Transcript_4454/m.6150 type:complete len:277 (+) Transcript_4454:142-972(+)|eukprot:CAMPEP_0117758760 /NCGR_PEP_ID=MMETSP0947-20121206/15599_1 /TAXON_ID=44440 /ORGANISM="Chattonella subsalsa, Strain CCMP2191" /LENGTH=276 /DNA_ID=CAMNT_0005579067 /DNA_START=114 /DNA_END=944 /DNA_ORIENTATION=+